MGTTINSKHPRTVRSVRQEVKAVPVFIVEEELVQTDSKSKTDTIWTRFKNFLNIRQWAK